MSTGYISVSYISVSHISVSHISVSHISISYTSVSGQILGQIFQCIEGQYGASTPVEGSIPIVRSPQEDFADAIYIAKSLKHWSR